MCRMSQPAYPPPAYPGFSNFSYPPAPGYPAPPAVPGMPAPSAMPGMPAPPAMPAPPVAPVAPAAPTNSRLVYGRTDVSMEEWRATQPQYHFQDLLTAVHALNL